MTRIEPIGLLPQGDIRRPVSAAEKKHFLAHNPTWRRFRRLSPHVGEHYLEHASALLAENRDFEKLSTLLTDIHFLCLKLALLDIEKLQRDYDYWDDPPPPAVDAIKQVLRLAASILRYDPTQLPEQILARIASEEALNAIQHTVGAYKQTLWLRPLRPGLAEAREGAIRTVPLRGQPSALALMPDDQQILVTVGKILYRFDLHSGTQLLPVYHSKVGDITDLTVTRNGQYAVAASRDGVLVIWDLAFPKQSFVLPVVHERAVLSVQAVEGSTVIAACSNGKLALWDVERRQEIGCLEGCSESSECVAVLDDGQRVIAGSEITDADSGASYHLTIWDLHSGKELASFGDHEWPVQSLAVVGQWVAAAANEIIKVWDINTHEQVHLLKAHELRIQKVYPVGTRHAISASSDNTLKLWDLQTGENTLHLKGHSLHVADVAATRDGKVAASIGDQTLRLWNIDQGEARSSDRHEDSIEKIIASPCGKWVITASKDSRIKVWDSAKYRVYRTLEGHTHWVSGLAMSSDGRRIASAAWDKTIRIWSCATGQAEFVLAAGENPVLSLAFHPDGHLLIGGTAKGEVLIWDLEQRTLRSAFHAHEQGIRALVLIGNGSSLLSIAEDQKVKNWHGETGELLWELEEVGDTGATVQAEGDDEGLLIRQMSSIRLSALAVTPDEHYAITGALNGSISAWDLQTRERVHHFKNSPSGISALCISTDGKYIATTTGLPHSFSCNSVRVWEVETQRKLAYFIDDVPISACTFVPGSRTLVVGDILGRVLFLELTQPFLHK